MSIQEIFLFVMEKEGAEEALMSYLNEEKKEWVPLLTASKDMVDGLVELADQISASIGKPYRILHLGLVGITRKGEVLQ